MVPFAMGMRNKLDDRATEMTLADGNQLIQTLLFDRPDQPFGVWGEIATADFFTTEVWTWRGLVTIYTVFVIELAPRRVHILGSTPHPDDALMG
jgi:hypothetical protein